jgi:ferredoxin hydrogenase gamma subunit
MFEHDGMRDVDVVLTIREFARLLQREGIDLKSLEPSTFDNPYMTEYTGAGAIFGTTGGVMEAAVRTLYYVVNGKELEGIEVTALRGFDNVRTATVPLGGGIGDIKLAICHGLKAARQVAEAVLAGKADLDFIEIMACAGGCVDGGGHLRSKKCYRPNAAKRREALFGIDRQKAVRQSHNNVQVQKLYADYLGQPLSDLSHHLLHTYYKDRQQVTNQTLKEVWKDLGESIALY